MFQIKVVEKNKTHILRSKTFPPKSFRLWADVKKKDRSRQARADNIMRRMRFACRITKERIKTHIVILLNAYCLSTATLVTRQRLIVVLTLPVSFRAGTIPFVATSFRYF